MKLFEIYQPIDPFTEPTLTDEEQITFLKRKAKAMFDNNKYVGKKYDVSTSLATRYFVAAVGSNMDNPHLTKVRFTIIFEENTVKPYAYLTWTKYIDPSKVPVSTIKKLRKDAELTQRQAEEYPKLNAKIKRLQTLFAKGTGVNQSSIPMQIPKPGRSGFFDNPAEKYKKNVYAGSPDTFPWPGKLYKVSTQVLNFLRKYCGINNFDVVYAGKGAGMDYMPGSKFSSTTERLWVIAVAAGGNIVWYANNMSTGEIYFPDGKRFDVSPEIVRYVGGASWSDKLVNQSINNLQQKIKEEPSV